MTQRKKRFWHSLLIALVLTTLVASPLLTAQAAVRRAPTIAAPTLISPAYGEETTGNPADPLIASRVLYEPLGIPTFEWEDVGASRYALEIATTAAFGSSVIFRNENLAYTTYTPGGSGEIGTGFSLTESSGDFADTATFYWHVRAWDDDTNTWSAWSSAWPFVRHWGYTTELTFPEDLSVQTQTPSFEWEPVPGASFYQIQVDTSDSFGSLIVNTTVDVPVYTPRDTFQNDSDLFWRVRAFHRPNSGSVTGGRGGPWSEVREFQMAWSSKISPTEDNRPIQIIPSDNANYIGISLFCWEPVEGAQKYKIDIGTHPQFVSGSFWSSFTENTCYVFNRNSHSGLLLDQTYYWRVTALDARNYPGQRTDDGGSGAWQFTTSPTETLQVPQQLYPPPYYEPIMDETFEDRTVASPTFVWDHVRGATSYELRIDDDIALTDPPVALVTTENASYTFTDDGTYPLNDGQTYYWRVRALGAPQGTPDWNGMLNYWPIRIDRSLVQPAASIRLLHPTYQSEPWTYGFKYGQESVTYYPSLSWTAVAPIGQATYQVQIAYDEAFNYVVHDGQTDFTEYTPTDRPEPGTYFWRVRQIAPSQGSWSSVGRFIVSRNFSFAAIDVNGNSDDWIGITKYDDDNDGVSSDYDLDGLYIANDSIYWYLGLTLPSTNAHLGFYFDVDHFDLSGAPAPPSGKGDPNWTDAHRPEFAIYWDTANQNGDVYEWNGTSWTYRGSLSNISASAAYDSVTRFLEMKLPVTFLDQPGSLSTMIVSVDGSESVRDKLPNIPGHANEAAFLTESTTPTPLYPANTPSDASLAETEHNTPVLIWRHNEAGYSGTYFFQTFEDETLTNLYENENGNVPSDGRSFWAYNPFWAPQVHYSDNNSYHWRIRRSGFDGAAPQHFQKAAYLPVDLQFTPLIVSDTLTYTNRTPSFSWQPAQSSPQYVWELWESGVRVQSITTMNPYYTPPTAIDDGTYTWKVYARDARGRNSAEAAQSEFRKVSDIVPVDPENGVVYSGNKLIFSWDPVDFAAYYRIEISDDPQFSHIWSDTTYNTTFTPPTRISQADDGEFYWRVYMFDNRNHAGPYIDLKFGGDSEKIYLPLVIR